ncbi:unnamed protein product [Symbiodinium sp. CCMP2592]|nr:unnamed protein product [Symbiodinium sp. CCMP2592]
MPTGSAPNTSAQATEEDGDEESKQSLLSLGTQRGSGNSGSEFVAFETPRLETGLVKSACDEPCGGGKRVVLIPSDKKVSFGEEDRSCSYTFQEDCNLFACTPLMLQPANAWQYPLVGEWFMVDVSFVIEELSESFTFRAPPDFLLAATGSRSECFLVEHSLPNLESCTIYPGQASDRTGPIMVFNFSNPLEPQNSFTWKRDWYYFRTWVQHPKECSGGVKNGRCLGQVGERQWVLSVRDNQPEPLWELVRGSYEIFTNESYAKEAFEANGARGTALDLAWPFLKRLKYLQKAMRDELEELKRKYNMKEPERAFMDEAGVKWRFGGPPNYTLANLLFLKGKTKNHPEGSLEMIVENLVKTWEMERSHKLDPNSHRSVDPKRFHISANGGKKFNNDEANKCGNYNVLLQGCDAALYDTECSWDKSHEVFHHAFAAFPWEVLECFSPPPRVSFSWRHWGNFTGTYEGHQGHGELIEMYGFAVAEVDDKLRLIDVDIYYKADSFLSFGIALFQLPFSTMLPLLVFFATEIMIFAYPDGRVDMRCKVEEYEGGAVLDELLAELPGFYFSFDYLKMLASASKTMLRAVRDRRHWQGKLVTMNTEEFQLPMKLRWMMEAYMSARVVTINVRQLTMFTVFPRNMLLDWSATAMLGGPGPAVVPNMPGNFVLLQYRPVPSLVDNNAFPHAVDYVYSREQKLQNGMTFTASSEKEEGKDFCGTSSIRIPIEACVQAPRLLLDLIPQDFTHLPAAQPDCSLLSRLHEHDRDKRINFLSETHVYYVDGVPMSISVTGLVHKFAEIFDADGAIANMQNSSRWPRPEYSSVQTNGMLLPMTAEEIKHMWLQNSRDAAHRGTWMHLQIEVLMNGGFGAGHWPELKLFGQFLREFSRPLLAFRTEWCIFAKEHSLAGCIDFVAKTSNNSLVLFDWKRTKNLRMKYTNKFRNMHSPLNHIPDCAGWHYRLQLNTYKYILEHHYGYVVSAMYVVCLHPDNMETGPFLDEVPNMSHDVAAMLTANAGGKDVPWQDVAGGADPDAGASQPSFSARLAAEQEEMDVAESPADRATQDNEALALALTQNGSEAQNDLALAIPSGDLPEEAISTAKKRRLMPGATNSHADFEDLFDLTATACSFSLSTCPTVENNFPVVSVKEQARKLIEYIVLGNQPGPKTWCWPDKTAYMLAKVLAPLQKDFLEERRLLHFLIQWCDTPSQRQAGCAYQDISVVYDVSPTEHVKLVLPSPENNLYVRISHPLQPHLPDPVLRDAKLRLEKFVKQTFWCNQQYYKATLAAIGLAKHGENIDRCFIGESAGGTGQSLFSSHLAAVYSHNHAFIDPNLFHNEEEMRKQLEQFAHCWIITAQEAPETHRHFQQDLYKKFMSADDLAGRKPYGFVTKMMRVCGFKRFETNKIMTFRNVMETNFNSIYRRCLVWKPQPIFVENTSFGDAYKDPDVDGIFEKDPTLRSFLESGPAIAAALQQQHGFESHYSRQDCFQLIEDYALSGLTERKVREACGLRPREDQHHKRIYLPKSPEPTAENPHSNFAAMLKRTEEEADQAVQHTTPVEKAQAATVKYFLKTDKAQVTKTWWTRFAKAKLGYSKDMFEELVKENVFLPVDSKSEPENFIPTIPCTKSLEDVLIVGYESEAIVVRERLNARKLWDAVERNAARTANAELLVHFYSHVISRLESGRGRKSLQHLEKLALWRSFHDKLRKHEDCAGGLLDLLEKQLPQTTEQPREQPCTAKAKETLTRRAIRKKSSVAALEASSPGQSTSSSSGVRPASPFEAGDGFVELDVTYKYKLPCVRTRKYGDCHSVQNLGTAWQAVALADTIDLDIENCSFTLLLQILTKLQPKHECWPAVKETLRLCAKERKHVIENTLKLPLSEGKLLLQKILNGGSPPQELAGNTFVQELQQASLFCRWVAATVLKDTAWPSLVQMKERPDVSVLTYFWNIAEDLVLDSWLGKVQPLQSKHMSLHFDGIRVDRDIAQPDVKAFCKSCSDAIFEETGLDVHIRAKERYTFHALLTQVNDSKAVAEKLMLHIFARLPSGNLKSGHKVLLHLATDGNPHSLAMEVLPGEQICVTDVNVSYAFPVQHLAHMLSEATDRKYILFFFYVNQKPAKNERDAEDKEYEMLLDTLAGGKEHGYDEFVKDLELPVVDEKEEDDDAADDDESVTRVGDKLLEVLRNEVTALLNMKSAKVSSEVKKNGRAVCPFCPMRSWNNNRQDRVLEHVRQYHSERKQFVASGTKQLKIIIALHDHDQCRRQPLRHYLRRSASLLAASLDETISTKHMLIDKEIRLVFTGDGPQYWSLAAVQQGELRRVRNLYYTRSFGQLVYALHARLLATFPGETNSLLPRHVNHWWPLVEDIFMSPRITSLEQELKAELVHHEEFEVVSMDATLRCCLPIMGQAHPRASREEKMRAAFHGETALTRAFWLHLCQLFVLLGLFLLYKSV